MTTTKKPQAKTPAVAFARALQALGLVRNVDFRIVNTRHTHLDATNGTYVEFLTRNARYATASNLDAIRAQIAADGGHTVGFLARERGDLQMDSRFGIDDLYWLREVLSINGPAK